MRYLFFDIEGANCFDFVSKMCSFGYVITSQDFKVNSKIDVIINPESQFDKHIIRQKMNAYPLEKYTTRPNFPYFYKSIKRMLEEKEQLIVGWSIENDVKYIYDACKRYHLEQIHYKYLDIQKVVMEVEGLKNQPALDTICELYNIKTDSILHKSDDDAYMTCKITKHLCKKLELSLHELYEKYEKYSSDVETYISHLKTDEEIAVILNRRKISYMIRATKQKNKKTNKYILKENIYGFSGDVIDQNPETIKQIIHYVYDCGARCSNNLKECNIIICSEKTMAHYVDNDKYQNVNLMTLKQFCKKLLSLDNKVTQN